MRWKSLAAVILGTLIVAAGAAPTAVASPTGQASLSFLTEDPCAWGPATAALEPFVDAMQRFHDRLPRLQPPPAVPHDTELDDAELEDLDFDDDQDTRFEDETFTNEDDFGQAAYDDLWDE